MMHGQKNIKKFAVFFDYSLKITEDFYTNIILLILIVSYPLHKHNFSEIYYTNDFQWLRPSLPTSTFVHFL